ncbi:MAG: hypothetical protein R2991_08225 [Thermoanaerobaculia bacterium]
MASKTDSKRSSRPSDVLPLALELEVTEEALLALRAARIPGLSPEDYSRLLDTVGHADSEGLAERPVMVGEPFSL